MRTYRVFITLFIVFMGTWMGSLEAQEERETEKIPTVFDPFISKAYTSVWTNNFLQDALHTTSSHVKIKNLKWFVPNRREDCRNVPEKLQEGAFSTVLCRGRRAEDEVCVCVQLPHPLGGKFHHLCGGCEDPCALRFNANLN